MANSFLNLQNSVLHQLGDHSGSTKAFVKRWLNDARNEIWEQCPGNYKEAEDYFTTTADYDSSTNVTVTVTNGSTTVTSDGSTDTAFTSAMVGSFIQLIGTDPWYKIAAWVSATEITLADAYVDDSDTDCAFEVHTYIYTIATDCARLVAAYVESEERETELEILDRVDVLRHLPQPLRWTRDDPDIIWIEVESSDVVQVGIYPVPDDAKLIRYRYQQNPTEMSDDTDTVGIPNGDAAVLAKALVYAFTFKGKVDRAAFFQQKADQELGRLLSTVSRTARSPQWRRADHTNAARGSGVFVNLGPMFPRRR